MPVTREQLQNANEWTAVYFAVAMLGLMATFVAFHWAVFAPKENAAKPDSPPVKSTSHMASSLRGVLLRKIRFFPTQGHAVIFFVYLVINIVLCFYDLDWSSLFGFATRLGWMAAYNMALITFLALKNTPLAFLTAYSYERLNCLHQMAGYCTVIFALLHAVVFTTQLSYIDSLSDLLEDANVMGIVAGLSMLIIFASALVLRKRLYEMFYIIHISLFMLILITVGMHRPDLTLKAVFIIIFAASIWVSDRIIRFGRITWYTLGNNASITPLARGGMRIVVRRSPRRAVPGSHVFLWIPKIRAVETHPFTVVSTNPLELVVSAHDGFTKDLFSYASKNPDALMRASVDGPYGALPNFTAFDQIILIAGGSGASFTFGAAMNILDKLRNSTKRPVVHFIWVVREHGNLTWYTKELEILHATPFVQLTIHVTRSIANTSPPMSLTPTRVTSAANEKGPHNGPFPTQHLGNEKQPAFDSDIEKSGHASPAESVTPPCRGVDIHPRRPDITTLLPSLVDSGGEGYGSTIVAACGPESLMLVTRSAVVDIVRAGRRNITLHCEQFGW